jgi:hypothetical protein
MLFGKNKLPQTCQLCNDGLNDALKLARSTHPDKHLYCQRSADWHISTYIYKLNCSIVLWRVLFFVGMGGFYVAPSHCGVRFGFVFCFGLFLCLRLDGRRAFFVRGLCWMGGMRMGINRKAVTKVSSCG